VLRERKRDIAGDVGHNPAIYWLRGAAADGGAVIAKLARRSHAEIEHTVYRDVLPRLPVSSIGCLGLVEESPELSWLFVEYADGERYSPANARDREIAGTWLGTLHAGASALPALVSLPERGVDQFAHRARSARAVFAAQAELPAAGADARAVLEGAISELSRLERRWDELEAICEEQPRTLVHGDFQPKNLCLRPGLEGPELMAFDWEEAGWGPPAIDLAGVADPARHLGANPSLDRYRQAVAEHGTPPDRDALPALAEVARALRCVSAMYWLSQEADPGGRYLAVAGGHLLPDLRIYHAWLSDSIAAMGWNGHRRAGRSR
jgi:aminoglycoside phosphotransferase (APT) family kinase protein